MFRPWAQLLPDHVELCAVQLPGREERHREPLYRNVETLIDALVPQLLPRLDRDFVLYGHSMGALIAFELARSLRRHGMRQARALIISSRPAPQLPHPATPTYSLSDADALAMVVQHLDNPSLGSAVKEPKWREFFLPIVRADIELCETHCYVPEPPLEIPLHAFAATSDRAVTTAQVEAWREQAGLTFSYAQRPGGHYFIRSEGPQFVRSLAAILNKLDLRTAPALRRSSVP
jgi:medium-chain acyl-[acyl-carrier-protein] hydrolase